MPIHFITDNQMKFEEVRAVVADLVKHPIKDLPEIQHDDPKVVIEAKLRAAIAAGAPKPFIVEDTCLHFDCLGGIPGPFIKWFKKVNGNKGLSEIVRRQAVDGATARAIIGYAGESGAFGFFEGSVRGRIVAPSTPDEHSWDPIFMPDGYDRTFAELGVAVKNTISHRFLAAAALRDFLKKKNS